MDKTHHFTDRPDVRRWLTTPQHQDLHEAQTDSWSARRQGQGFDKEGRMENGKYPTLSLFFKKV
ncbi:hypothetical protein TUM12370_18890 [Salmonella enterica subsp. enterica serovar Choleraesuis]|nr:hypothetical protein TUM12370_18890 [Salmonella enterica subsp. enterica serovar Choleraesuis]